jgi:pentatricopeptide repeat protein
MGTQAIELYRQMPEGFVDEVTYISVLNACSHSGLCEEARLIFKNIQNKTVKIHTTMVYKKDCCNNFE